MNYLKATEKYLYNYQALKANIEILEQQLEMLKAEFKCISAIDTTQERLSKTYKVVSVTEDEVLQREHEIVRLEQEISREKNMIEKIDKAIDLLPDPERALIKLRYIESKELTWIQIANKIGYSPEHCRGKLKRKVIKKISITIFGIETLHYFEPKLKEVIKLHPDMNKDISLQNPL